MKATDYDAIVVGCGPAGLSAAIYLSRAKAKTLLVGKSRQSQLAKAHSIENFFGFPEGISGEELLKRGTRQAKRFGTKMVEGEAVSAKITKGGFRLKLGNGDVRTSRALIIATGTPIKLSGIANEEELTGKGVHYCVECDAPFYNGKKVAVIGSGNHAAEDAKELGIFTKDVTVISNSDGFAFSEEMKKALEKRKVALINSKVTEFSGKKALEAVVLEGGRKLRFDGVFMACGTASALNFASELGLEIENNVLVVDKDGMTNVRGIFAAGNCSGRCRQVAKNVGDGCNAALSAIRYLRNQEFYSDYSALKR